MVKVLIVDDHPLVRKAVALLLTGAPELKAACDEASNAREAARMAARNRYQLVVLDIGLPGTSGLDLLKSLRRDHPALPVVILTMYPEDQYGLRALSLGAAGYLTKESAPDELVVAARKALSGGRYVSSSLAERLVVRLSGSGRHDLPHEALSDRQFEVLRLTAQGMSPAQISDRLCLSVKTISTYRSSLLKKMGMRNVAELVNYAIRNHMVE